VPALSGQEQIVVPASRVTELQDEVPTKVLTVTKEEIPNTGYERVGDVLSEVTGVVTQAQSFGGRSLTRYEGGTWCARIGSPQDGSHRFSLNVGTNDPVRLQSAGYVGQGIKPSRGTWTPEGFSGIRLGSR
jgi:hypothetical protein